MNQSAGQSKVCHLVVACPRLSILALGRCGGDDAFACALRRGLAARAAPAGSHDSSGSDGRNTRSVHQSLTELDANSNQLSGIGAAARFAIATPIF